ncbi:preprotein translocase subunit SECE1 [Zingiber officinale]|uniref:Preprotein translocase subunit SECE1 n=1 Tax=Zingiber officinale TaxID=94328 RepID=A0A8J5LEU4_ZINOF|nr:preprotein translocase subunit SECE1 [Zingiber officinale]KAG6516091.1 hypothetical protein ZIOFF_026539 [Zingiber officinale]
MAVSCSLFQPSHSPPPPLPLSPALPILHAQSLHLRPPHASRPLFPSLPTRRPRRFSAQGNGGASEILEESEADEERNKPQREVENGGEKKKAPTDASVAEELKEVMAARRKESSSSSDFWVGVAEEVKEIEWPPFGKVVGTTGVVLAVIAGSSVALLTVNAILAEISDKVFAGKGIQDFF